MQENNSNQSNKRDQIRGERTGEDSEECPIKDLDGESVRQELRWIGDAVEPKTTAANLIARLVDF